MKIHGWFILDSAHDSALRLLVSLAWPYATVSIASELRRVARTAHLVQSTIDRPGGGHCASAGSGGCGVSASQSARSHAERESMSTAMSTDVDCPTRFTVDATMHS